MHSIRKFVGKLKSEDRLNQIVLKNTVGAFIVKGGSVIISLLTMPAYIRYFDNQSVLGIWFTIISILNWILNFDLGIGNGLRNHLVQAFVQRDKKELKKYISSAYFSCIFVSAVIFLIGFFLFAYCNWNSFFNISTKVIASDVLLQAVRIIFAGVLLQFVLKLITSILYAMQKSAIPGFLNLISNLILLVFVTVKRAGNVASKLISLAWMNILAVNIPLLLTTVLVLYFGLKKCFPSINFIDKRHIVDIMKLGGAFFIIQCMYMIIMNTNEFLITWFLSPKDVVDYQIYNKIFMLIGTIFNLALTPIWSAVTQAISEKKYTWIMKTYSSLKKLSLLGVLCNFLLVPFLQPIINLWLGNRAIHTNTCYGLILAVFGCLFIWNGVISSIVNGIGKVKLQLLLMSIGAVLNFPVAYLFAMITHSWISIIFANVIALLPYCIIQPIWISHYFKKLQKDAIKSPEENASSNADEKKTAQEPHSTAIY